MGTAWVIPHKGQAVQQQGEAIVLSHDLVILLQVLCHHCTHLKVYMLAGLYRVSLLRPVSSSSLRGYSSLQDTQHWYPGILRISFSNTNIDIPDLCNSSDLGKRLVSTQYTGFENTGGVRQTKSSHTHHRTGTCL